MARKKEPSFEEALAQLEDIVRNMENGDASLAELMDSYAKGVELSGVCIKALERAEKAMDIMVQEENDEVHELELKIEGD